MRYVATADLAGTNSTIRIAGTSTRWEVRRSRFKRHAINERPSILFRRAHTARPRPLAAAASRLFNASDRHVIRCPATDIPGDEDHPAPTSPASRLG